MPRRLPAIILLEMGWDQSFGQRAYLQHPVLTLEAAGWLWDRGVRVFASDTLNPDAILTEHGDLVRSLPVHGFVLGNDGIIVENLRNLSAVPSDRTVFASVLPLSIAKADGSPIRAAVRL